MTTIPSFVVELPFPVTANHMWRVGRSNVYASPQYTRWKTEAQTMVLMQRRQIGAGVVGNFTYHVTLDDRRRRRAMDGDNRVKCILDLLQNCGLIENDKFADAGSWCWGASEGCTVLIRSSQREAA